MKQRKHIRRSKKGKRFVAGRRKYTPTAEHSFKIGDKLIYSDFGIRSIYVIKVLPYRTLMSEDGLSMPTTSVRGEIINDTMGEWDFGGIINEWDRTGTVHTYHYTNLYKSLNDLAQKEKRILQVGTFKEMMARMKKHKDYKSVVEKRVGHNTKIRIW